MRRARLSQLGISLCVMVGSAAVECQMLRAQGVQWSLTEATVSSRDTVYSVLTRQRLERRILEVVGLVGHNGADTVSLAVPSIQLRVDDAGLPSAQRMRQLIGIGVQGRDGQCGYHVYPLPRMEGVSEIALTGPDSSGFFNILVARRIALVRNPSRLCLAFAAPATAVTRVSVRLGRSARWVAAGP